MGLAPMKGFLPLVYKTSPVAAEANWHLSALPFAAARLYHNLIFRVVAITPKTKRRIHCPNGFKYLSPILHSGTFFGYDTYAEWYRRRDSNSLLLSQSFSGTFATISAAHTRCNISTRFEFHYFDDWHRIRVTLPFLMVESQAS